MAGEVSGKGGRLRRSVRELYSAAVGKGQGGSEGGAEELSCHSHGLCEGAAGLESWSCRDTVDDSDTGNHSREESLEDRHVDR